MSSPRGRSLSASCSARGCRRLGCSRSGLDQRVGGCWLWGRGGRCLQVAGSGAGSVSIRGLAMPRHRRSFTLHPLPAPIPKPRVLPRPGTHLQGRIRWIWSGCGVHVTAQPGRATVIADQAAGLGPSDRRSVRAPSLGARTTTWAWSDCSCCFAYDNCGSFMFDEPSSLCPEHTCYEYQLHQIQQAAEKILASQPGVAQLAEAWS